VALDFDDAERELAGQLPAAPAEADAFFHREFVRALFARAVEEVRREYEAAGRTTHLLLFERYDLDPQDGCTYAGLARETGLTTAQVTNYLAQIRRSFRTHVLDALEALSATREEFRRDARELLGVEVE
jgi:hypothetical protein